MTKRILRGGLQVDPMMVDFIETKALPDTGVDPATFWQGFSDLVHDLGPKNHALLAVRAEMQRQIDAWHIARRGQDHDAPAYEAFLHKIGYLLDQGDDFSIQTKNVDPEIAQIAGPQLVVPITNARFALNAANARWGSLYDALYGTDVMGDFPTIKGYNPSRGARVIKWGRAFLDSVVPLAVGSHGDHDGYCIKNGALVPALRDALQLVGYKGDTDTPSEIVLINNGLHIVIEVNSKVEIGANDRANVADIRLESTLSTIMDCEDSVATVDTEDKILAYSNWLGLMQGDLTVDLRKNAKQITRRLADDHSFTAPNGQAISLKGRSLMLVRNVGHLMGTPAMLDQDGGEVGEGLMDAMLTTLIAMHDLRRAGDLRNSQAGSVYVVKPKMHGPDEVAFADEIFSRVEQILGLPQYTVKLGIMDEERRTSVNLKECIRAAKHRVAFINTGFLDRTGDEIHTSMEAGVMLRKSEIKNAPWIAAYEDRNVDIGLACGLQGKAQIGKGMWAMPDRMADMLKTKIDHPLAGANCAWVPSPTAATLHATHYHRVDVFKRQDEIAKGGARGSLQDLLTIPLATGLNWSDAEITAELENNAQGILGYVVRWIDQGVGCSTVPDIHDVGLMEDRATCRISSQALANWLHHGVVCKDQLMQVMRKMAAVVDGQNANDPLYRNMAPGFDGIAFQAACDLVFLGRVQPSGYTEPVLHARRLQMKASIK